MPQVKNARLRHRIIDECLRNNYRPFPSIEYLRQSCEEKLYGSLAGENISKSTIEKDLREMKEEYDAPIQFSRLKKGYYYSDANFSLEQIPLSDEDAEALRFAVLTLDRFKHLSIFKQFNHAINKIFDRVYISNNLEDEAIDSFVQFETAPVVNGTEWLAPLFTAIKSRQCIDLRYQSLQASSEKTYFLHPYLLKEYRHRWYLIAYRPDRDGIFTFELGRISALKTIDTHFEKQSEFNVEDYFRYAFGITVVNKAPETLQLRFDLSELPFLKSQPLHSTQTILSVNDEVFVVQITVYITPELIMSLLAYGHKMSVLSPSHLADMLKDYYQKALKKA